MTILLNEALEQHCMTILLDEALEQYYSMKLWNNTV